MLAVMDTVMLLGELTPQVPRNFPFVAFNADDQELTVRAHKGRDLTVPQLSQKYACHSPSHFISTAVKPISRLLF